MIRKHFSTCIIILDDLSNARVWKLLSQLADNSICLEKNRKLYFFQWKKWCDKVTTWWFWTEVKNNLAGVHLNFFCLPAWTIHKAESRWMTSLATGNLCSSSSLLSQVHSHCPCIFHWPWGSSCRTWMRQSHFPREYLIWLIVLDRTSVELLCCQIKFGQCAKHYSLLCKPSPTVHIVKWQFLSFWLFVIA